MSREIFDPGFDRFEESAFDEDLLRERIRASLALERARQVDEDVVKSQAEKYIAAEVAYIQSLHEMVNIQRRQKAAWIKPNSIKRNDGQYFYHLSASSRALHDMTKLTTDNAFVIGGPEKKYKAMTMHKYNPDLHWIMPDDYVILPPRGAAIVALTSEVGIKSGNSYEQLLHPFFAVPDKDYPGIEWDTLANFLHLTMTPSSLSEEL